MGKLRPLRPRVVLRSRLVMRYPSKPWACRLSTLGRNELIKNGGIALCAPIAPYTATRRKVREMIEPVGGFFEVYVSTPIEVCEQRDRKGLYAKARAGVIKEFTGVSDPYEAPMSPELVLNAGQGSVDEKVEAILAAKIGRASCRERV